MFRENFRVALRALTSNKLRSVLTTLGIIIGVMSVIALMSLGNGVQAFVVRQFEGQGANLVFIIPARVESGGTNRAGIRAFAPGARAGQSLSLTQADADAMRVSGALPDARIVAPVIANNGKVAFGENKYDSRVRGTVPEYRNLNDAKLIFGNYIDETQTQGNSRVAVLGDVPYRKLFPDGGDPTGTEIRINNISFVVIGVLAQRTGGTEGSDDDVVIVPITTARERLFPQKNAKGQNLVNVILLQATNKDRIDALTVQATNLLRERHNIQFAGEDDFTIASQRDLLNTIGSALSAITYFIAAIAAISLFVGGIGIMNIMLVSVTERTREIGLRKAVGARRAVILAQFLIESIVLSLIGGTIGILLGVGLAAAVAAISQGQFNAVVTPDAIALAVGFSVAVGIIFGTYPAARAARLSPIEALRYE
jgi:putative ABC transport system permease protein